MRLQIFPRYDDIFPGDPLPELEDILCKSSAGLLLKSFAYLNSKLHLNRSNLDVHERIFYGWLKSVDADRRISILENYSVFKSRAFADGCDVVLYSPVIILKIIQEIIIRFSSLPVRSSSSNDHFIMLEAWLVMNEKFDNGIKVDAKSDEEESFLAKLIINEGAQYEFLRLKDWGYQLILARVFFDFCSKRPELLIYLNEFLRVKNLSSFIDYITFLAETYTNAIIGETFGFKISPDGVNATSLFDSMAYDLANNPFNDLSEEIKLDEDFKMLRDRPLIRDFDGSYYIMHYNFFVDKLYQGLQFDFYRSTSIKILKNTFSDYLGFLGQ